MADRKVLKDRVAALRNSKKNRYAEGGMAEEAAGTPGLGEQAMNFISDIRQKDQASQDNLMAASRLASQAVKANAPLEAYQTPESQMVAQDNLNVAMGAIQPAPTNALSANALAIPNRVAVARKNVNAIQNLIQHHADNFIPGGPTQAELGHAIDNLSRISNQYNSRGQRLAEGGEVGDTINYDQLAPKTPAPQDSGVVNVRTPEGELTGIPREHLQEALGLGYTQPTPAEVDHHFKELKYGTTGQMAKTALEGAASGLLGSSIATGIETGTGIATPEDIRGREETNPVTHGVAEAGTFLGSALIGTGEARVLAGAGEAAATALKVGEKGGWVAKAGVDAAKAAFEGALYQVDQEGGKLFKEDPEQSAGHAISDIGLATVMSGVFGGAIGAGLRKFGAQEEINAAAAKAIAEHTGVPAGEASSFVSELDKPKLEAGDFKTAIEHSDEFTPNEKKGMFSGLARRKPGAGKTEDIGEQYGLPVMEGMISADKLIQRGEDSLINGGSTAASVKRQQMYREGHDKASSIVDGTLGEGSKLSKAQIGDEFKQSLASQIKEENAPIKAMYDSLKMHNEFIPLDSSASKIAAELEAMPEYRLIGSLPGGNFIKGAIEGISKSQTVDDLKVIRSAINGSMSHSSSSQERRVAALVSDKLRQLEEDSIETFARVSAKTPEDKAIAMGLNAARKEADATYKPFIQKVQKLSKMLGKGNIGGPQDAIRFINELEPEKVTARLFNKNNSQGLKFFEREFPEQAAQMRDYQRGILRDASTKEGVLNPDALMNKINKLEPEARAALFSKEELKTFEHMTHYLDAFPPSFNPSGTAHAMALRDSFMQGAGAVGGLMSGHPIAAAIGMASPQIRDAAIAKFITSFGASPRAQQAIALAKSTAAGDKLANRGLKLVFSADAAVPPALLVSSSQRDKLARLVDTYHADPEKMVAQNDSNPIPEYAQAFSATSARAVQYLSGLRPDTAPKNPLDSRIPASAAQKAIYASALDIAQQPLHVLAKIKNATLTPQDVTTIKTIYPSVYQNLSTKMMSQVVDSTSKGNTIPYQTRLQLSMFLGQPMDSTMTQSYMAAAQAKPQAQQQRGATEQAPASGPKRSTSKLDKLAVQAQTPGQARQSARSDNKL